MNRAAVLWVLLVFPVSSRSQSAQPEDVTIPAVCYENCNDAYLEAQKVGTSNSILCQEGSKFLSLKNACKDCLRDHNTSTVWIEPYLAFCDSTEDVTTTPSRSALAQNPTRTDTSLIENTTTGTSHVTIIPSRTDSSLTEITTTRTSDTTVIPSRSTTSIQLVFTEVEISTEIGGYSTVLMTPVTYRSYPGDPITTAIVRFVRGYLADHFIPATSSTISQATAIPTPAPPIPASTHNMAWVVGPVIGAVALLLWRWAHQRVLGRTADGTARQPRERFEKPELPVSLSGVNRQEIDGTLLQELEHGRPYRNEGAEVNEAGGAGVYEVEVEQVATWSWHRQARAMSICDSKVIRALRCS
ncbi:hypothetical protein PG991_010567 [Apiospora marii]|uniref:Uncharacterized protein n=1 Tax=Apiospora marii TaxID=335849 RepID=A0ABR1RBU6_9PEZI